jgi:TATA-box binding protein (TBP) (component of TFIID and TFIIIB)
MQVLNRSTTMALLLRGGKVLVLGCKEHRNTEHRAQAVQSTQSTLSHSSSSKSFR